MPAADTSIVKGKILNFLGRNGPSLPVHIAKDAGMDMLFTSAFLSELISHQKIKTSNMKVGTSPIYFLPGQEGSLERFSEHIKGKEREAWTLLKRDKFLIDSKQEPAIRVALRAIKDFAKPFEKNGEVIWRYFTTKEEEYLSQKKEEEKIVQKEEKKEIPKKEEIHKEEPKKEEKEKSEKKKKPKQIKSKTKKSTKESDEKFFNKVKEYLAKKGIILSDIINFNKKELILKVLEKGEEKLLFAYNKKRISEKDILNAYKKSEERKMNYMIFSLGEPPKKTQNLIDAAKKLDSIEKID